MWGWREPPPAVEDGMSKSLGHALVLASLSAAFGVSACNADTNNASGGADGNSAGGAASGNSASGSSATSGGVDYDACFDCGDQACSSEASECDQTSGCRELLDCIFGCDQADSECQLGCVPSGQETAPESMAASLYYGCTILACLDECTPDIDVSTSSAGGAASSSATPTSTTSSSTNVSNTTGGTSTTGSTSATTTGGIDPVAGVNWLSFDGSWADPSVGANGALGVSGSMYSFGDSCATVSYDEATRCVSGTLCDPGTDFANWGMAIGFDFYNTGDDGTPPNTRGTLPRWGRRGSRGW
jgi:hypothetical protein